MTAAALSTLDSTAMVARVSIRAYSLGAIQVLRNADGGGGYIFPEKSVTKV